MFWIASNGPSRNWLRVSIRKAERKDANSAAWVIEMRELYEGFRSRWTHEDENDIEELLPLFLTLTVFDFGDIKVVFPCRFTFP